MVELMECQSMLAVLVFTLMNRKSYQKYTNIKKESRCWIELLCLNSFVWETEKRFRRKNA